MGKIVLSRLEANIYEAIKIRGEVVAESEPPRLYGELVELAKRETKRETCAIRCLESLVSKGLVFPLIEKGYNDRLVRDVEFDRRHLRSPHLYAVIEKNYRIGTEVNRMKKVSMADLSLAEKIARYNPPEKAKQIALDILANKYDGQEIPLGVLLREAGVSTWHRSGVSWWLQSEGLIAPTKNNKFWRVVKKTSAPAPEESAEDPLDKLIVMREQKQRELDELQRDLPEIEQLIASIEAGREAEKLAREKYDA